MWGYHLEPGLVPKVFRNSVHFHPTLPEDQVIPELARCTFVYAMYPMVKRLRLFSITSMQTKLGSYIKARRPIFGQGPAESSLADFLNATGTGTMWNPTQTERGLDILNKIMGLNPNLSQWQNAREQYFGEKNIELIKRSILNLK